MNIFPFKRNNHVRDDLSAYLDGQLPGARAATVEAHVAACAGCRLELADLRATVAALRGMPQAQPPRSFAVTERMLARGPAPQAAADGRWSLEIATRMAGAAVAVALAVVVVIDIGGTGGGGGDGGDDHGDALTAESSAQEFLTQDDLFDDRAGGDDDGGGVPPAAGTGLPSADTAGGTSGGVGGVPTAAPFGDGDAGAAATPQGTGVPVPGVGGGPSSGGGISGETPTDGGETTAPAGVAAPPTGAEREVEPDGSFLESPAALESADGAAQDDDGGTSTLTFIEVILGGALALVIAAAVATRLFKRERTI